MSSLLMRQFGWMILDPICSLFISLLIFISVLPLVRDSAMLLLQATPDYLRGALLTTLDKVCEAVCVNTLVHHSMPLY